MPTYQYACTACGHRHEAVQTFADEPLTECPACQGKLRKLFSAVGIVFKGSGFYRTDSRVGAKSGDSTTPSSTGSSADSSSADSSSSSSSSGDSKPSTSGDSSSKAKPSSGGSGGNGSGGNGSGGSSTPASTAA